MKKCTSVVKKINDPSREEIQRFISGTDSRNIELKLKVLNCKPEYRVSRFANIDLYRYGFYLDNQGNVIDYTAPRPTFNTNSLYKPKVPIYSEYFNTFKYKAGEGAANAFGGKAFEYATNWAYGLAGAAFAGALGYVTQEKKGHNSCFKECR